MEKQQYKITINAPREKVWDALWEDKNYRTWTAVFAEGSSAKTDNWKEGTKVMFTDGTNNGMVALIEANRPNEFMSFKHLGMMKDGEEADAGEWAGAHENYTLTAVGGQTDLAVDIDIADAFKDYFSETWPKALARIKELAEKN